MAATNPKLTAAREALVREQTEAQRIKNQRLRGELISVEEHKRALDSEMAAIRAAVLSLPGRIARELPQLSRVDRATIDRLTRALLNEMADAEPPV